MVWFCGLVYKREEEEAKLRFDMLSFRSSLQSTAKWENDGRMQKIVSNLGIIF